MATPLWARLDVRHLVSLAEVARSGSFTAAAESLGYTQSAVSQQIARLERTVGHRVVDRSAGGRSVTLTPAGRVLVERADTLTHTLRRIAADVGELSRGAAGILRVGCFESVGSGLLPATLDHLASSFPRVRVVVHERPDDGDLLDLVAAGELDLTFVVFPLPDGPFRSLALLEDPYVLVTSQGSPEPALHGPVDLDDHPDLPLMAYAEMRPVHAIESRVGGPVSRGRVVFRSNHNSTLLGLAAQGYAAAVLPRLGLAPAPAGVRLHALAKVSPRVVGVAWRDHQPLAAATDGFLAAARAAADDQVATAADEL